MYRDLIFSLLMLAGSLFAAAQEELPRPYLGPITEKKALSLSKPDLGPDLNNDAATYFEGDSTLNFTLTDGIPTDSIMEDFLAVPPFIILSPRVFANYQINYAPPFSASSPFSPISEGEACEWIWKSYPGGTDKERLEEWLQYFPSPSMAAAKRALRFQYNVFYSQMMEDPSRVEFLYWKLPKPPKLPQVDESFRGFLSRQHMPGINTDRGLDIRYQGEKTHWLHTFDFLAQLSQAYVSGNWYQGGTSHLAFVGGFLWDVMLNNVYHPNAMFQSTVSYKLSVNSTPEDKYHDYNVSQDLFQYNLKTGFKAYHNWFYSFMAQFKTQFVNSYPANSQSRAASFLSPADLNLGLGMTYNKENKAKTLKFSASLAPISYNLKICIDPKVDHSQFGVPQDRKWVNEIGSNAEVKFYAKFWGNVTYNTRLFLFSDYTSFQGDWENTLNFQFSSLFSTQIYAHLRYDTSTDRNLAKDWGKLMMKEILSVGIAYHFSTKSK